jgi:hypothetical protein
MRIRSMSGTLLLMAGIVASGGLASVPALGAQPLQVDLQLGSPCMGGTKPHIQPITVKLLRANGTTLEARHDDSAGGGWMLCFLHHVPVAGNKLQLINGSATHSLRVPDFTLAISRTTDLVSGRAPAATVLHITYHECYPAGCDTPQLRGTTANSNGRYHKDLSTSAIDIDGSDQVDASFSNSHGDSFLRTTFAPYVEIKKPNGIYVSCVPRGTTTVKLRSSSGALRATRSFHATQDCSGFFGSFRKGGHAINVHTGDRITSDLSPDARLVWPTMSVNGSVGTLSGRCLANSQYMVFISRGGTSTTWSGTTDPDGIFLGTPSWKFQAGDRLDLICESSRGDHVRLARTL